MPSASFQSITPLCERHNPFPEHQTLQKLKRILAKDPGVVHELDDGRINHLTRRSRLISPNHIIGGTLLHHAAKYRSVGFCKLLAENYAEASMVTDNKGRLPFHYSCRTNNLETAKYLFELYPWCIDVADSDGNYPIHYHIWGSRFYDSAIRVNMSNTTQFLLYHDQGAVTKLNNNGSLSLHIACLQRSAEKIGNCQATVQCLP